MPAECGDSRDGNKNLVQDWIEANNLSGEVDRHGTLHQVTEKSQ